MAYQHDAQSVDVAARLRELREGQGMSMRALAAKSGLSANALSMIERGKTSPSVSTLYKLADALGVPITEFFSPQADKQNAILIKADERTRVPFANGVWEGLGGELTSAPTVASWGPNPCPRFRAAAASHCSATQSGRGRLHLSNIRL